MYAIEFETVIKDKYIELHNADSLINKHVRVIVLVEENEVSLNNYNDKDEIKLIENVFIDAENHKIDESIDIDKICNEVNA